MSTSSKLTRFCGFSIISFNFTALQVS